MRLLQIILHVLWRGFSMVPVLCDKVKMHPVLNTQQGFCEGNPLARPELVEFVNPGMFFKEGYNPVHQMLKHTDIDGMKDIRYRNGCR